MRHIDLLENDVILWAEKKGLLATTNSMPQTLKAVEEMGEVARAVLKEDHDNLVEEIGDVLVTLTLLANINGTCLNECFAAAYNKIKNRTGKTVNGTFIKDEHASGHDGC